MRLLACQEASTGCEDATLPPRRRGPWAICRRTAHYRISARPRTPSLLFALAWILAAGLGLHADDRVLWRTWGVKDGFVETYTSAIAVSPNGYAYTRHGSVESMSIFDGYRVTKIPDPSGVRRWVARERVQCDSRGSLWAVSEGVLMEFKDGAWTAHSTSPPGQNVVAAIPGAAASWCSW